MHVAGDERRVGEDAHELVAVGHRAVQAGGGEGAGQGADGAVACRRVGDDLGDHRVVVRGDRRAGLDSRVDAHAVGDVEAAERARRRPVAGGRVLGRQADLDGVAVEGRIERGSGQRLDRRRRRSAVRRGRARSPARSPGARPAAGCSSRGTRSGRPARAGTRRCPRRRSRRREQRRSRRRRVVAAARRRPLVTGTPRRSSGGAAGSSSRARAARRPSRACRRRSAPRRVVLPRRSARRTRRRRRTPTCRLALGVGTGLVELAERADDAHAAPTTARRCLHQQRQADLVDVGDGRVEQHGHAGGAHQRLRLDLRTHRRDRIGWRADPHQPGVEHRLGEAGGLGEEAVARMDGVGAGAAAQRRRGDRRAGTCRPVRRPAGARRRRTPRTCRAPASASLNTATVRMPSRRQVRAMRQAISPRLAIRMAVITSGTPRSRGGRRWCWCARPTGTCRARCGCRGGR